MTINPNNSVLTAIVYNGALVSSGNPLPVTGGSGGGGAATVKSTASAPTYVEGATTNPVSTDLHGSQRVLILDSTGAAVDWTSASTIAGPTASGSPLTSSPITEGGLAKTSLPTAVSDGNVVNAMFDKFGRQIVKGSLRELKGKQSTTITASTSETTFITAGSSGIFNDIYILMITNTSAVDTTASIREATAGSVVAIYQVPAGCTVGFAVSDSSAVPQATAANNWTIQLGTSVSSVDVFACYVQNK